MMHKTAWDIEEQTKAISWKVEICTIPIKVYMFNKALKFLYFQIKGINLIFA